ncbi:MAG: hypothetical protein UW64_C0031G0005 [Microgenomates group bacterium GW2011_GWC1_44_37]|nr:MAG: hypothetical protein UW64_C0031G0005 [Microgenomates group bacterium GW2011_GWC1_44_37]
MAKEIRIYYESYEQAVHYIKPIIRSVFVDLEIKLIYLSKGLGYVDGSLVSRILKFKNPDILISYVSDEEETPLFVIEFSEAVTTEDHELQRFDGYLGAVAGKCFYVKISPFKESQSRHGGNTGFDTFEPYALIYKKFGLPSFHFEWPLETPAFVKRDPEYFSCPPPIHDFAYLITETIMCIISDDEKVRRVGLSKSVLPLLIKNKNINTWLLRLSTHILFDNSSSLRSSRLKWLEGEKVLLFKFNRMGHAMDPERGMIWYYRYRYDKPIISRMIFPSTGDEVFNNIKLLNNYDYLRCFAIGTGLDKDGKFSSFLNKKKILDATDKLSMKIDISDFLKENFELLNKQLYAIFSNSSGIFIQDKSENTRVALSWKNDLGILNQVSNTQKTKICERNFIEEDDITYIVAHQVLKKNQFKIISLSYPGAQGDRAILPQAGSGRGQSRKYIDIVACYPNKFLDLTENKGSYKLSEVSKDIEKLNFYRSDDSFITALNNLVDKISPESKGLPILLSVSFWTQDYRLIT